jgi:hypothetical protein
MKDNQHEQLFTELTPQEAAVIEGGKRIFLQRIKCIRSRADDGLINGPNTDDVKITLGGDSVWGPRSMDDGHEIDLHEIGKTFNGSIRVRLSDHDPADPDDFLGQFTANNITNGWKTVPLEGSGSKYELTYKVTA